MLLKPFLRPLTPLTYLQELFVGLGIFLPSTFYFPLSSNFLSFHLIVKFLTICSLPFPLFSPQFFTSCISTFALRCPKANDTLPLACPDQIRLQDTSPASRLSIPLTVWSGRMIYLNFMKLSICFVIYSFTYLPITYYVPGTRERHSGEPNSRYDPCFPGRSENVSFLIPQG